MIKCVVAIKISQCFMTFQNNSIDRETGKRLGLTEEEEIEIDRKTVTSRGRVFERDK